MGSVNQVTLVGRLGKDPEMRYTSGGLAICTVSLATESYSKEAQGQKKTDWHRCVLFDKLAELATSHLKKGALVYFNGALSHRDYEDKQGIKRYVTEIKVHRMQFLESARAAQGGGRPAGAPAAAPSAAPSHEQDAYGLGPMAADDVPF